MYTILCRTILWIWNLSGVASAHVRCASVLRETPPVVTAVNYTMLRLLV